MTSTTPTAATSVYLPMDLKEWLHRRSVRHHRSTNKELVAILSALREGENAAEQPANAA